MIADRMVALVQGSSVIRAMFEEGKRLAGIYGAENVYDYSLGNPSVAPPKEIEEAIKEIIDSEAPTLVHGYMSNAGYEDCRQAVAEFLNKTHGTNFGVRNIMMCVGAAGGMNVAFRALLNPQDEVLTFAPYFGEYKNYVSNFDGVLRAVSPNTETFQPNLVEFEQMINEKTKAVIVNSPNNPTGVVYSEETIKKLAESKR